MDVEIKHGPGNAAARVGLAGGESCTAEAGAMISMSGDMGIETTTHKRGKGSLVRGLKRMLAGESFFMNHFTAGSQGGEVWLAATLPGDMLVRKLEGDSLIVQAGSYVASADSIEVDFGWQGFKSLLSGESMFWLHLRGSGPVVVSAFGCVYPIDVNGEVIVDSGHIVAFEETLDFSISKAGRSWLSSFLGGEGLVCRFGGRGTVWCQSHNPNGFGKTLGPMLPPRK